MHYEVNYTHITDEAQKRKAAIRDCKNWLGRTKFERVCKGLVTDLQDGRHPEILMDLLCIVGIQGYAARAFVEYAQERATPKQLELDLQMPVTFKARIMPPVKI